MTRELEVGSKPYPNISKGFDESWSCNVHLKLEPVLNIGTESSNNSSGMRPCCRNALDVG